jgi:membrane protease YdiL (CAAX protease family)
VTPRSHPAGLQVATLDGPGLVWLLVAAAVVAPLVEETVFRGLLYQPLRASTRTWPRALSFLFAAAVQALLFAVVHPQGIGGVPAIAAMGAVFSLVREWRGSLIASMTMHGVWNGTVLLAALCALR